MRSLPQFCFHVSEYGFYPPLIRSTAKTRRGEAHLLVRPGGPSPSPGVGVTIKRDPNPNKIPSRTTLVALSRSRFFLCAPSPFIPPQERCNMPKIPAVSPATGERPPPNFVHTVDGNFVDSHGRTLLFRGVNLSGSSKAPVGEPSYLLDGFWESAEAGGNSFISRPLNLDDGSADVHLARLRGWGLTYCATQSPGRLLSMKDRMSDDSTLQLRGFLTDGFLVGSMTIDFMDYTIRVLRKCKEYGFKVYMDPHQDIVSPTVPPVMFLYLTAKTVLPVLYQFFVAVSPRSAPGMSHSAY
jgi:hypothetical protein